MKNETGKRTRIKPDLTVTVALIIIASLAIGVFIGSIMKYNGLRKERDSILKESSIIQERIDRYKHDLNAEIDDKYIESVAKDKLNLINPDEIIIHSDRGS